MSYTYIEQLVDNMLKDIFKDKDIESLSEYEKSYYVYKYLTDNIKFDYELWENNKAKKYSLIPNPKQQVIDIFEKHKGYCSAISQAYKLLLEKLGILVMAVGGYDEGDIHQFIMVKRGENWSFDDVTLGIIKRNERDSYFDYDDLDEKKQTIMGVLPEEIYDAIYGRDVVRTNVGLVENESSLYDLPANIRSTKNTQEHINSVRL